MTSETNSGDQTSGEDQYEVLMAELEATYAEMSAEKLLPVHELATIRRGMTSDRLDRSASSISSIIRVLNTLETIKTSS